MRRRLGLTVGLLTAALATPALAHPGHGAASLAAGLAHPFGGADHLLAMALVGLLAARRREAAAWAWPAVFLAGLLAGYAAGAAWPGADAAAGPAIAATAVMLGLLAASAVEVPAAPVGAALALAGLAHGWAHGAEAPPAGGLAFPAGFLVSSVLLHGLGLAVGRAGRRREGLVRLAAAASGLGAAAFALAG